MSVNSIKLGAIALLTSVCGFATAPAFAQNAASVTQISDQNTTQVGSGNVSVQGNMQTGVVTQSGYPSIQCFVAPCPTSGINGANVLQSNQQGATQIGSGNSSIQGNASTATVSQGSPAYPYYPYYPSNINGAMIQQGNLQQAGQFGYGNSSIQGNAADATLYQH